MSRCDECGAKDYWAHGPGCSRYVAELYEADDETRDRLDELARDVAATDKPSMSIERATLVLVLAHIEELEDRARLGKA
jgi:hypothetical protein